jgi:hypothetical protein
MMVIIASMIIWIIDLRSVEDGVAHHDRLHFGSDGPHLLGAVRLHVQPQHVLSAAGPQEGLLPLVLLQHCLDLSLQPGRLHHLVLDLRHPQVLLRLHADLRSETFQVLIELEGVPVVLLEVEQRKFEEEEDADSVPD